MKTTLETSEDENYTRNERLADYEDEGANDDLFENDGPDGDLF